MRRSADAARRFTGTVQDHHTAGIEVADYVGGVEAGGLFDRVVTENGGIIPDGAGKCRGLRRVVPEVRVDGDVLERSDASGVADAAGEHGVTVASEALSVCFGLKR